MTDQSTVTAATSAPALSQEQLLAIIAAGPGGAAPSAASPIGVPGNYVALPQAEPAGPGAIPRGQPGWMLTWDNGQPSPQPPRYFEGDQFTPSGLPTERIAELQAMMAAAGVISAREIREGVWDDASTQAYTQVLAYANQWGVADTQVLATLSAQLDENPPEPVEPTLVSDPSRIRADVREAFMARVGREPQPDELNAAFAAVRDDQLAALDAQQEQLSDFDRGLTDTVEQVDVAARSAETIDSFFQSRYAKEQAGVEALAERQELAPQAAGLFNTAGEAI